MAGLVGEQLTRYATLNPYQLAGPVKNLDFRLEENRHALAVIDGYGGAFHRASRCRKAIHRHQINHRIRHRSIRSTTRIPPQVRKTPDRELQHARKAPVEAAKRFLARCKGEGLVKAIIVDKALAAFSN